MGATIGDVNNPVKLYLDNIYTPKGVKINSFIYDKIIASQNNKILQIHSLPPAALSNFFLITTYLSAISA